MSIHRIVVSASLSIALCIWFAAPARAIDYTWAGVTSDMSTATNWNPAANPHSASSDHIAHFGSTGVTGPTIGNTNFWVRQIYFDAGAQAYTITANSGAATVLEMNAPSYGLTDALINNSDQQQIFNVTTGRIAITGAINTGSAAGGSLVINGILSVAASSNTGIHHTALKGSNDIYFNVDSSINPAGNVSAGGWLVGGASTTSSMYLRARGRFFMKDFAGRAYLGNIGTAYAGTFHIDSTMNGALRLTNNNSLGSAATSGNNRAAVMLYGGATNGTLELSNNITVSRGWTFIDGRSTDDPHILNVSGNNTYNVGIDWNTGTYAEFGTTADDSSSSVTANSGNWNLQSDSGKLTINGGPLYNTVNVTNTLQLMGAGDGQIDSPLYKYQTNPSLNLLKKGTGTWTFTNIPNTASGSNLVWTGTSTVNEGTLRFKPAASATLSGAVTVNDGGKLAITSFDTSSAVVNTSALNLGNSSGGAIDFEVLGSPSSAPLIATAVTASSNNTITILNKSSTQLATGTFPLIDYTTINDANFDLNNTLVLPTHVSGHLSMNGGTTAVDLVITDADTLRWNGASDNVWNINGAQTQNWKTVLGGADTKYLESTAGVGDFVTFDDSAVGNFTVDVSTSVAPATINFNNSANDYTLNGTGAISTQAITKDGSKDATIANTGAAVSAPTITVNNGKLTIANTGAALTTSSITVNSGKLTVANSGGTFSVSSIAISGGEFALNRSDSVSLAIPITGGGALRQEGSGTTTLTGNNSTFSGQMVVTAGTLKTYGNTTLGMGGSSANGVIVHSGATLDIVNGTTTSGTGTEVVEISGNGVDGIGALVVTQATNSNGHVNQLILNADSKIASYSTGTSSAGRSILWVDGPGAAVQGNNHNLSIHISGTAANGAEIDWLGVGNANLNNVEISGGGVFYLGGNSDLGPNGTLTFKDSGRLGLYGSLDGGLPGGVLSESTATVTKPIVVEATGGGIELHRQSITAKSIDSTITLNGNLDLSMINSSSGTNCILALNGKITGPGSLGAHTSSGASTRLGTVQLISDDNDYAGTTTIGGGGGMLVGVTAATDRTTLSIGNGGGTGKIGPGLVDVGSAAFLQFFRNNDFTVANVIQGLGSVRQAGTGTTTVSNTNTYTGATYVNAGTLKVTGSHITGSTYRLGNDAGTNGTLILNGTGITTTSHFWVGLLGNGHLTLENGDLIVGDYFSIGDGAASTNCDVNQLGGNATSTNDTVVGWDGTGTYTLNAPAGSLNVLANLVLARNAAASGTFNLQEGLLNVTAGGGKIGRGAGSATFNFTGGTLKVKEYNATTAPVAAGDLGGLVQNGATSVLDVTGNDTILHGGYTLTDGTAKVARQLTVNGDVNMASGSEYQWQLAALSIINPGTDFGLITLSGNLTLDATSKLILDFSLPGVNDPNSTDTFWDSSHSWKIIETATNTGNTNFGSIDVATYASGTFATSVVDGDIFLNFTTGTTPIAGDFDGDGDVDGADFIAWQTNFPGTYDGGDFGDWQTNFPSPTGGGSSPVPEPATWLLAAVSALGLVCVRKARRRNS